MEIKSHSLSHQDLFILVCRSVYLLESHLELIQYTHLTIEVSNRIRLIQTQLSFRVKVLSILFILFYLSCVVLIIIIVVPIIVIQMNSHHERPASRSYPCWYDRPPQTENPYISVNHPPNMLCNIAVYDPSTGSYSSRTSKVNHFV